MLLRVSLLCGERMYALIPSAGHAPWWIDVARPTARLSKGIPMRQGFFPVASALLQNALQYPKPPCFYQVSVVAAAFRRYLTASSGRTVGGECR